VTDAAAFDPQPVTLEGRFVRLEPVAVPHAADLFEAGRDDSIWRFMPRPAFERMEDAQGWIERTLDDASPGVQIPFAVIDRSSGRAVGSTRYLNIRRAHRGPEIGWTWLAVAHQRTAANTECKLLLLGHAFDRLGAIRVEFKTDGRNERSQRALEQIGAVREGVLRHHMIMWDGHVRDSVYFGIIASEWPVVRERLEARLARRGTAVSAAKE
jgi:RimJ/RimL family protein N-acetyltransferase